MSDQHDISVEPDAIYDTNREPILTREEAERAREQWTREHPPVPGLQWRISFNLHGEVSVRHLEVIPGWEDAFAPPVEIGTVPADGLDHSGMVRAGRLAYASYVAHAGKRWPINIDIPWEQLSDQHRESFMAAGTMVWQHAENAGFHAALLRTLPSARLGAAGEIDNARDMIAGMHKLHGDRFGIPEVLRELAGRGAELRRESRKHRPTDTPKDPE